MNQISMTDLQRNVNVNRLRELFATGDLTVIVRHNQPFAVIYPYEEFIALQEQLKKLNELLENSNAKPTSAREVTGTAPWDTTVG